MICICSLVRSIVPVFVRCKGCLCFVVSVCVVYFLVHPFSWVVCLPGVCIVVRL